MVGIRIVIADNDPVYLRQLKSVLQRVGHNVIGDASDGVTALRLIRSLEPDLIILDAGLPTMDSLDIAKLVEEEHLAPIILLASHHQRRAIDQAKDHAVMAYLVKPVPEAVLINTIEITMSNYDKIHRLEQEVHKLKDTLESRKAIDKAKGLLMKETGLNEDQAFRRIQKQAMESRKTMKEIAQAIIIAFDIKA